MPALAAIKCRRSAPPWKSTQRRASPQSSWQSPGLPGPCRRGIAFCVQRIKAAVALVLALVWLPAVSCCLIDASGLLGKQDCCSKEHSHSVPGPGHCEKPCGTLASATYLWQQDQLLLIAPVGVLLFDSTTSLLEVQQSAGIGRDQPATAPPELVGCWQFSFRAALPPRAPCLAS
jgi:hypothetical protein